MGCITQSCANRQRRQPQRIRQDQGPYAERFMFQACTIKNLDPQERKLNENQARLKGFEIRAVMEQEINQLPHCLIGQLHAEFMADNGNNGLTLDGTAFMIAPDLVLTAAHNVYQRKLQNKTPIQCSFTLGLHNKKGRFTTVLKYRFPQKYARNQNENNQQCRMNDYALLKIEPIFSQEEQQRMQFMRLSPRMPSIGEQVKVYGYAVDRNVKFSHSTNGRDILYQFGAKGKVLPSKSKFLTYEITTQYGQSGSPVVYKPPFSSYSSNSSYEIVGIHKGTSTIRGEDRNYAVSTSIEMIENIKQWKYQMHKGRIYIDGGVYEGDIVRGYAEGNGVLTYSNGDRYQGEFRKSLKHGYGIQTYAKGYILKYEGEFKDDEANGKGTIYYANGDKFQGEFKDNKRNGKGTIYFANGDKFVAEYKDDKLNGKGTYYFKWQQV